MEQESQNQPDIREQQIVELEAKLKRANQVIDTLQQQNIELQKQVRKSQLGENQDSSVLVNNHHVAPPEKSHTRTKRTVVTDVPTRKLRLSNLTPVQYYGLMTLVVIFVLALFGLGTLVASKQNSKNPKVVNPTQTQPANNLPNQLPNQIGNQPKSSIPPANIANSIPVQSQPISITSQPGQIQPVNLETYNVTTPPKLDKSENLAKIVDELVTYAKRNNLPTESLSITLIDAKNNKIAGYRKDTPRYPASVVKLFWMVALLAQNPQYPIVDSDLNLMILKSDNDAASRILDRITGTQSLSQSLDKEKFKEWKKQRQQVNVFFQKAGYETINISQKTFPIPQLQITEPKGTDLQIRGDNPQKPIRNKITTNDAGRLMYEIINHQAVSRAHSQQMLNLLTRDLNPAAWKQDPPNLEEFNPVEDFFGELLSTENVNFASKAGWTTNSRQEVASVSTKDGKTSYILAIFGDDPAYAKSKTVFPQMSRIVFENMTNK